MKTKEEAIAMRDVALTVVRTMGRMQQVDGRRVLMANEGDLTFLLTTPFQRMPGPRPATNYGEAIALQRYEPPLPYMIDVFAPRKVLSVSWDGEGKVHVTNFKRGPWQEVVARLAADASTRGGSPLPGPCPRPWPRGRLGARPHPAGADVTIQHVTHVPPRVPRPPRAAWGPGHGEPPSGCTAG